MKYTVFGSAGFIGSRLMNELKKTSDSVVALGRSQADLHGAMRDKNLGHVFYCIGLTSDFRSKPIQTVEAHVCVLKELLEHGNLESITYLSSTRVYESVPDTSELSGVTVAPTNPSHLYNLSKLMGESLCLNSGHNAKVVRLSNVYGPSMGKDNFLASVLIEAKSGKVTFRTSPSSSKDFVSIDDIVELLPKVATSHEKGIFNLASGTNVSNQEIARILESLGVEVSFLDGAPTWSFPKIDITRLCEKVGTPSRNAKSEFPQLFTQYLTEIN